ncbi:hypothetical protein [Peribacillus frigoritolerans]|uniref:hypothetical protein n=1 Tax=Peribacillus castrilensis TaxID=2897690 RepID=UPI00296F5F43|nr:hypothetical protein [Peribacillus castrilensis]
MMNLLGFDGAAPYSIINWQLDGEKQSKTVCYSGEEEKLSLERFHTDGDFYSTYDKVVVNYGGNSIEYDHVNQLRRGP